MRIYPDDFIDKIICGDCLEIMRELPDGCVDAVVTDPPYGMGKDFKGNGSDSEQHALWLLQAAFPGMARLVRNGGMAFVFSGTRLVDKCIEYGKAAGLQFHRLLWMYKPNDCTYPWRGWLLKSEAIVLFSKGKPRKWQLDNYCHDTYIFNHSGGELPKGVSHPSVKPLSVVADIVAKSPGDIILDPFLGSGTTAVACIQTGRHFIGIEREAEYCDIARKRVFDAHRSLIVEGAA